MAGALFAGTANAAKEALEDYQNDELRNERKSYAHSNDVFSLTKPPPVLDANGQPRIRQKSTRAKAAESGSSTNGAVGFMKTKIQETWRRVTESQCDPYVQIELKPAMTNIPIIAETDAIVGGGKYVEWTSHDNNELIFLLENLPEKKYLNVLVFDQDIGADDRALGKAPIRLETVTEIGKQYYTRINLYQGSKWTGQIDLGAKLEEIKENEDTTTLKTANSNSTNTVNVKNFRYKLLITVISADDLEDEDRTKTPEENFWVFILGLVAFVAYLCFGAMVFSLIEEQEFNYMLWFFIVSTTTVGYGDWSPETNLGHILNSFFIITNLFVFAWAFSATFNYIYAQQEALLRAGGRTRGLRDFVQKFTKVSNRLDGYLKDVIISEIKEDEEKKEHKKQEEKEKEIKRQRTRSRSRTSEELELKREKQLKEQEEEQEFLDEELKFGVIINFSLLGGLMIAGTLFYSALDYYEAKTQISVFEGNDWPSFYVLDPVRFTIMTMTTVGYGDMYPQTESGRIFGSFFLIVGVSFLTRIVGSVFEIIATKREQEQKKRTMERALSSVNAMQEFDEDGSGDIDRYEFLKTMLIIRGEVSEGTIKRIMKRFNELDADGSGEIDFEDFVGATRRATIKEKQDILSKDSRQRTVSANQDELLQKLYDSQDGKNNNNNDLEPIMPLTPITNKNDNNNNNNNNETVTPQTITTTQQLTPMTDTVNKALNVIDGNDTGDDFSPKTNSLSEDIPSDVPRTQTDKEMLREIGNDIENETEKEKSDFID